MTTFPPITAIVLAGGTRDDVCRDDPNAVNKAFVNIGGAALVTRALRALREATSVKHIIVVAPETAPLEPLALADERRNDGPRIGDSLQNGLRQLDPDALVLISASDLPVLTPMAVDDFIQRLQMYYSDCDIAYGYLDRRLHEQQFPEVRHTWMRFREGVFCGTGLCAIRPRALPTLLTLLDTLADARKAPWRLASLLGIKMLMQYALGILGIAETEDRAKTIIGVPVRGVPSPFPESAINIDRYEDLKPYR